MDLVDGDGEDDDDDDEEKRDCQEEKSFEPSATLPNGISEGRLGTLVGSHTGTSAGLHFHRNLKKIIFLFVKL